MAKKRVLLIYEAFYVYYDERGSVWISNEKPSTIDFSFWDSTLWCLFDGKGRSPTQLDEYPYVDCNFIVSTSPRRDLINDFKKYQTPLVFYMPVWTEYELEKIAPLYPNREKWKERFRYLGGIPRYVLEDTKLEATAIIRGACKASSIEECTREIGLQAIMTDHSKCIHSLIHVNSVYPFDKSSTNYASPGALDIIIEEKGEQAKFQLYSLLESMSEGSFTGRFFGGVFEKYAIDMLQRGGTFICREVLSGGRFKQRSTRFHLVIPQSEKIVVDRVQPNQAPMQLYVPKSKTYTAIDAWIPAIGAFQMTISMKHDINGRALTDFGMLGHGAKRIYWCLPPTNFDCFSKQSSPEIEQYAVRIPFYEETMIKR
jgi:hypothetical protein